MKDEFNKKWIIENSIEILKEYELGELTIRSLHYRLVSIGMHNTQQHYKRVVNAMIEARWSGDVLFNAFSDHERETLGSTKYEETNLDEEVEIAKNSINSLMNYYFKNRWENQPIYTEVFIEKKALQGLFEPICDKWDVALNPCKGYPSLTFINNAVQRFKCVENKEIIILYFGDYDPSGEDIPRSIEVNFKKLGCDNIEVKRIALNKKQVMDLNLPPAPKKVTDSRSAKWNGLGQVELDAVEPNNLKKMVDCAISELFNKYLHEDLKVKQREETITYQKVLKEYVSTI